MTPRHHPGPAFSLLLAVLAAAGVAMAQEPRQHAAAALITHLAGVPVFEEELALHRQRHRALVAARFHQKHGVSLDSEAAWFVSHGGETPAALLDQHALAACLRDKAIQILAVRHGLGEILPFPRFAATLEDLHARRAAAHAAGRVLHGPLRPTPWQHYRHCVDTMRLRLKHHLGPDPRVDDACEAALAAAINALLAEATVHR